MIFCVKSEKFTYSFPPPTFLHGCECFKTSTISQHRFMELLVQQTLKAWI